MLQKHNVTFNEEELKEEIRRKVSEALELKPVALTLQKFFLVETKEVKGTGTDKDKIVGITVKGAVFSVTAEPTEVKGDTQNHELGHRQLADKLQEIGDTIAAATLAEFNGQKLDPQADADKIKKAKRLAATVISDLNVLGKAVQRAYDNVTKHGNVGGAVLGSSNAAFAVDMAKVAVALIQQKMKEKSFVEAFSEVTVLFNNVKTKKDLDEIKKMLEK